MGESTFIVNIELEDSEIVMTRLNLRNDAKNHSINQHNRELIKCEQKNYSSSFDFGKFFCLTSFADTRGCGCPHAQSVVCARPRSSSPTPSILSLLTSPSPIVTEHSRICSPSQSPLHPHQHTPTPNSFSDTFKCHCCQLRASVPRPNPYGRFPDPSSVSATGEASVDVAGECGVHVPKNRWRRDCNCDECSEVFESTGKRGSDVKLLNDTSSQIRFVFSEPIDSGRCVSSLNDKSTRLKFGSERQIFRKSSEVPFPASESVWNFRNCDTSEGTEVSWIDANNRRSSGRGTAPGCDPVPVFSYIIELLRGSTNPRDNSTFGEIAR
ncbi:hypothetical protein BLNAU_5378 [Blattamonas nauphoetae]|uniref:Uncharacterized protein n=1 Tax=Blattamonas nauphoetae TaxID=2049346 RepID=A0ABQ9Y7C3_9EUKA|nr:hypothetical protein BLNAU_5378 [Blattamonas nauphoetae]